MDLSGNDPLKWGYTRKCKYCSLDDFYFGENLNDDFTDDSGDRGFIKRWGSNLSPMSLGFYPMFMLKMANEKLVCDSDATSFWHYSLDIWMYDVECLSLSKKL